ncbi:hypothetical protein [Agathobaculum butyriciproducens]|uniref:hypothetical protein n=1 Tax=Agathobaculum butyriciproducens TaxID=1628085 RepID=UPI0036D30B91
MDETRNHAPTGTRHVSATAPARKVWSRTAFRLPSAYDNRPLNFDEFNDRLNQIVYVSATPAEYELSRSGRKIRTGSSARPVC